MVLLKNHPPAKQNLTDLSRISKPNLSLEAADIMFFLAGSSAKRYLWVAVRGEFGRHSDLFLSNCI